MAVTALTPQGPLNFMVDTYSDIATLDSVYLDAGARAFVLDEGFDYVYSGTVWIPTGVSTSVLAADFDVDSGGTGTTITATNLALPVGASRTYTLRADLYVTATTSGGIEIDFTSPSGATMVWQTNIFQDTAVVTNDGENDASGVLNYIAAALSFDVVTITGTLTTSTTAGTLTLRAAQDTSHGDNTIIHAGSSLTLFPAN